MWPVIVGAYPFIDTVKNQAVTIESRRRPGQDFVAPFSFLQRLTSFWSLAIVGRENISPASCRREHMIIWRSYFDVIMFGGALLGLPLLKRTYAVDG